MKDPEDSWWTFGERVVLPAAYVAAILLMAAALLLTACSTPSEPRIVVREVVT